MYVLKGARCHAERHRNESGATCALWLATVLPEYTGRAGNCENVSSGVHEAIGAPERGQPHPVWSEECKVAFQEWNWT